MKIHTPMVSAPVLQISTETVSSLKAEMKISTRAATMPGRSSGRVMSRMIRQVAIPEVRAAASRLGTPSTITLRLAICSSGSTTVTDTNTDSTANRMWR
ncbi:MAG: hypothetical protein SNJ73_07880 [Acetobacteraceae bacterium]